MVKRMRAWFLGLAGGGLSLVIGCTPSPLGQPAKDLLAVQAGEPAKPIVAVTVPSNKPVSLPSARPMPPAPEPETPVKPETIPVDGVKAPPMPEAPRPVAAPETEPFRFPEDGAGTTLARVLPPSDRPLPERTREPRRILGSRLIDDPAPPLISPPWLVLRLPAEPGMPAAYPRLTLDEGLSGTGRTHALPESIVFTVGERVKVPSLEVNEPVPVPILGQRLSDPASLEDPTVESLSAEALKAPAVQRTQAVPFVRVAIPDPFENRQAVRLPPLPPESTSPETAAPRVPGR